MKSALEMLIEELEAGAAWGRTEMSPNETQREHAIARELLGPPTSRLKLPSEGKLAECGSPYCAGCYDVGDGKKIHPPRCGEEYRKWLERWEAKGKPQ
jgi:hypothetical protein